MEEEKKVTKDVKENPKEGHFMRNRGKYLLGLGAAASLVSSNLSAKYATNKLVDNLIGTPSPELKQREEDLKKQFPGMYR